MIIKQQSYFRKVAENTKKKKLRPLGIKARQFYYTSNIVSASNWTERIVETSISVVTSKQLAKQFRRGYGSIAPV